MAADMTCPVNTCKTSFNMKDVDQKSHPCCPNCHGFFCRICLAKGVVAVVETITVRLVTMIPSSAMFHCNKCSGHYSIKIRDGCPHCGAHDAIKA